MKKKFAILLILLNTVVVLGLNTATAAVGIYCVKTSNPNKLGDRIKPSIMLKPSIDTGQYKSIASASSSIGTFCVITNPIPLGCEIESSGVEVPVSISQAPMAAKTFFNSGSTVVQVFTLYGEKNKPKCTLTHVVPPFP